VANVETWNRPEAFPETALAGVLWGRSAGRSIPALAAAMSCGAGRRRPGRASMIRPSGKSRSGAANGVHSTAKAMSKPLTGL